MKITAVQNLLKVINHQKLFHPRKFIILQCVVHRKDRKATVPSVTTNEKTSKQTNKKSKDFQLQLFLRKIITCLLLKKIGVFSEVQAGTTPTPLTAF